MITPLISVIVPARNRADRLKDSLQSIQTQSYHNFEIIVIDDASNDDTAKVAETYSDDRTHIFTTPRQLGPGGARNLGVAKARGSWIAFLDSDDQWLPNKLQTQTELLSGSRWNERHIVHGHYNIHHPETGIFKSGEQRPVQGNTAHTDLLKGWGPLLQSTLISKSNFFSVGGFDENLESWEDWDFAIRCAPGSEYYYIDDPVFNYTLHHGNRVCRDRYRFRLGYIQVLHKHAKTIKQMCDPQVWHDHLQRELSACKLEGHERLVSWYNEVIDAEKSVGVVALPSPEPLKLTMKDAS